MVIGVIGVQCDIGYYCQFGCDFFDGVDGVVVDIVGILCVFVGFGFLVGIGMGKDVDCWDVQLYCGVGGMFCVFQCQMFDFWY